MSRRGAAAPLALSEELLRAVRPAATETLLLLILAQVVVEELETQPAGVSLVQVEVRGAT